MTTYYENENGSGAYSGELHRLDYGAHVHILEEWNDGSSYDWLGAQVDHLADNQTLVRHPHRIDGTFSGIAEALYRTDGEGVLLELTVVDRGGRSISLWRHPEPPIVPEIPPTDLHPSSITARHARREGRLMRVNLNETEFELVGTGLLNIVEDATGEYTLRSQEEAAALLDRFKAESARRWDAFSERELSLLWDGLSVIMENAASDPGYWGEDEEEVERKLDAGRIMLGEFERLPELGDLCELCGNVRIVDAGGAAYDSLRIALGLSENDELPCPDCRPAEALAAVLEFAESASSRQTQEDLRLRDLDEAVHPEREPLGSIAGTLREAREAEPRVTVAIWLDDAGPEADPDTGGLVVDMDAEGVVIENPQTQTTEEILISRIAGVEIERP